MVPSQKVVATCRLPWHFEVGQRQGGQGASAACASGITPSQNGSGCSTRQQPIAVDMYTSRPCATNELGVSRQEPLILPSPVPLSLSEGGVQGVSCVLPLNTQPLVTRGPGAISVARPTQRKRDRTEADLDNEDSQNTTRKRNVRPRLRQRNNVPTGTAGPSAPPTKHSRSRRFTTAARTARHDVSSSNSTSNFPATSAPSPTPQPDSSLRPVQAHQGSAQPVELITPVLLAANPRRGLVSGGPEIWLEVDDLPTTFALYVRFGDKVAVTVSSTFHPPSHSSSNPPY